MYLDYCEFQGLNPVNHRNFKEIDFFLLTFQTIGQYLCLTPIECASVILRIHDPLPGHTETTIREKAASLMGNIKTKSLCYVCKIGFSWNKEMQDHIKTPKHYINVLEYEKLKEKTNIPVLRCVGCCSFFRDCKHAGHTKCSNYDPDFYEDPFAWRGSVEDAIKLHPNLFSSRYDIFISWQPIIF